MWNSIFIKHSLFLSWAAVSRRRDLAEHICCWHFDKNEESIRQFEAIMTPRMTRLATAFLAFAASGLVLGKFWSLNKVKLCVRHGSVVSSAPTILQPPVRIPSTPSTLFSIFMQLWWEKNENRQKEAGIGPFKKVMDELHVCLISIFTILSRLVGRKKRIVRTVRC